MSRIDGGNSTVKVAEQTAEIVKKEIPRQEVGVQNPLEDPSGKTKVGDLQNLSDAIKSFLNDRLNAAAPTPPPAPPTPHEALEQIKNLPPPTRDGIPSQLPPEDRQAIYDGRVRDYNNQRAAIADRAITAAQPPKREDFAGLPPQMREIEYTDALNGYNQNLAELKQISREAKQANLELNPEFKKLPAESQQLVKDLLVKNQDSPQAVDTIANLAKTEGFNKLNADEQTKLLNYVGGTNKEISAPARNELNRILNDPAADKTNPETFRKFLTDQPGLTGTVGSTAVPGQYDANRRPYTVTGPTEVSNHGFRSGNADALRYEVEIDGKKVPVYMPKNPAVAGEHYHSIEEVAKGLASLPKASLDLVNSVNVDPKQNPDDAYWATQYNQPGFRSYMTAGADGNISVYPTTSKQSQEYLDSSLIHETGHTLSKQRMGETSDPLRGIKDAVSDAFGGITWNDWNEAMASDGVSPSTYAKKSPDEDFAETLTLYMTVKGTPQEAELRAIFPERFALMDKILGN